MCSISSQLKSIASLLVLCFAMKFSVDKAVKDKKKETPKRAQEQEEEPKKAKFMKTSQIVIETGPKPEKMTTKKLAVDAPVIVCIYKATDHAGCLWESYVGDPQPLWQIQISHEVSRPITYQFRDRFADFLKTCKDAPDTLQDRFFFLKGVVISASPNLKGLTS